MEKIRKNKNYFFQIFIWDIIFLSKWVMCKNFINIWCDLRKLKKNCEKKNKSHYGKNSEKSELFFSKIIFGI